jgi:hypothetical protein
MNARQFSFDPLDLEHEVQGERDDDFDAAVAVAAAARRQAAAIRTNALTGHQQTLEGLAEDFAHRVSQPGVTETLIRTALSCGPSTAGQMLLDLIQKGVDLEAEVEALKEVERMVREPEPA